MEWYDGLSQVSTIPSVGSELNARMGQYARSLSSVEWLEYMYSQRTKGSRNNLTTTISRKELEYRTQQVPKQSPGGRDAVTRPFISPLFKKAQTIGISLLH